MVDALSPELVNITLQNSQLAQMSDEQLAKRLDQMKAQLLGDCEDLNDE